MIDKHKIATSAMTRSIREEQSGTPVKTLMSSMKPLIDELNRSGFKVETLGDLRRQSRGYRDQIPLLLTWLSKVENVGVKEEIVRCLTLKDAPPVVGQRLILEFLKSDNDLFKWTIGNALSEASEESVLPEMLKIVDDTRHGRSRQMIVLGLGRFPDPAVYDVLVRLLRDEDVCGHAAMALGKLKYIPARESLISLLRHEKSWIRKKAKQAVALIDRRVTRIEGNRARKSLKRLQ